MAPKQTRVWKQAPGATNPLCPKGRPRSPGPRLWVGAALGEPGWVGASMRPGGLPGGPLPGNPSQETAWCARRTARAAPPVSGPPQQPSSLNPIPSRSLVRKDAWSRRASRRCGQSTRRTGPGARGVETQAPGDALDAPHLPRPRRAPAQTHPRPELAPGTARHACSPKSPAPAAPPNYAKNLFPAGSPSSPGPCRGALGRQCTGSLSSTFCPAAPEETELSLRTRPAGSRGRCGAQGIPSPVRRAAKSRGLTARALSVSKNRGRGAASWLNG